METSVLIVDDSSFFRAKLKKMLNNTDYNIIAEASNGSEAVELYAEHRPDIVTMDVIMPSVEDINNGIDAIQKIREFDPYAKIVLITALDNDFIVRKALKSGAMDYIGKPVKENQVLELLDSVNG